MKYAIDQPFPPEFNKMSKKELREYWDWYHARIPECIEELTKAVTTTPGFENWIPDSSIESLETLGTWFEGQVETRSMTKEELLKYEATNMFHVEPPRVLTSETYLLAWDVAMYFSQVVLKNLPDTRWGQILKGKRNVFYGCPVIVGFGTAEMEPVNLLIVVALKIADGQKARLREVYEVWKGYVKHNAE